ncbi:MAG: IS1182 family transposase [Winogradskyella sp.]|uniref:IS1182 family transposase n=1 Tax=Winogradskyella sp. TaxID=1883156 RepID=UPI0017B60669|nr:IS1182 family transposase [Winogradskyella sp.]
MPQIKNNDRDQLMMLSLAEHVSQDSTARVIDAFINASDMENLGFIVKGKSKEGRPAYPPEILAKLYLYGYLHGIRSSRKLEHACKINIELWWLLENQKPHYKTIADFRKDNPQGFANLFIFFRDFCLKLDLYGKETVAIDGSKFRAQNSKKNNYNQRKIDKHLHYIDEQFEEYIKGLDENDRDESLKQKLDQRRDKYNQLNEQLNNTDETQISTTDPDARALPLHMRIVEVGYNIQSAVDSKNNLIVDYQVTNKNDHRALAPMALKAKEALKLQQDDFLTVLADKGYHTGEQIQTCHDNNIETLVAAPKKPKQTDLSKPVFLRKESFLYNDNNDTYTCPNGQTLTKQARYKRRDRKGRISGQFDRYNIKYSICKNCHFINQCVSKGNRNSHQGRYIDRYLSDKAIQNNAYNIRHNKPLYKRRQAIVEHPFGTIKRQWGYTHTLLKTIPKVSTEFSIILLCYNIRRSISILGHNGLKKALNSLLATISVLRDLIYHASMRSKVSIHHPSCRFS